MELVSKKNFAKIAGRSPASITKALKIGKLLETKGRIDLDNPYTVDYLEACAVKDQCESQVVKRPGRPKGQKPIQQLQSEQHGDDGNFVSHSRADLEIRKLAAEVTNRELKNAQIRAELVSRELVLRGVWSPLETFLTRLLSDGAKTIAARVYPVVKAGGTIEEAEVETRKQLSTLIKPLIKSVLRALKLEEDGLESQ